VRNFELAKSPGDEMRNARQLQLGKRGTFESLMETSLEWTSELVITSKPQRYEGSAHEGRLWKIKLESKDVDKSRGSGNKLWENRVHLIHLNQLRETRCRSWSHLAPRRYY
jgi:hypothetical protein